MILTPAKMEQSFFLEPGDSITSGPAPRLAGHQSPRDVGRRYSTTSVSLWLAASLGDTVPFRTDAFKAIFLDPADFGAFGMVFLIISFLLSRIEPNLLWQSSFQLSAAVDAPGISMSCVFAPDTAIRQRLKINLARVNF